jgi:hypothetical protein
VADDLQVIELQHFAWRAHGWRDGRRAARLYLETDAFRSAQDQQIQLATGMDATEPGAVLMDTASHNYCMLRRYSPQTSYSAFEICSSAQ